MCGDWSVHKGTVFMAGRALNADQRRFGIVVFAAASEEEASTLLVGAALKLSPVARGCRMKATLHRLTCTAVALILIGCAHHQDDQCRGCTSVYLEGGQLAIAHFAPADPSAVDRVAASYCQEHHSGKPVITKHPELQKYPHWAVYLFSCEDRDTDVVVTKGTQDLPVVQQSAVRQPVDIEAEKLGATCTGMGIQKGTPEYGNCILKLMEMSNADAEQLRRQQRVPTLTTIRLPSGEILTCTQAGDQLNCK
jgi:hypothetical protein